MPLKAVLSDLEWNIVIVAQQRWATIKISFVVIFTRKFHKSFLKGYIEPCSIHAFSHLTADVDLGQHYCGYSCFFGQTWPAGVRWPENDVNVSNDPKTNLSFAFVQEIYSFKNGKF